MKRKLIDENGRVFGLISIIDVVVLMVVAVLALALGHKKALPTTSAPSNNVPITFTAVAEAIPDYVAQSIRVGDTVYDKDQATGGAIGVITSVNILPGRKSALEMSDGTVITADAQEYSNVEITVEGSGLVSNGRYSINRVYEVGVNASRNFYTKYALFKISVTEIA